MEEYAELVYVEDHFAKQSPQLLAAGRQGEEDLQTSGAGTRKRNLEIVETVCDIVDESEMAQRKGLGRRELITFVQRPTVRDTTGDMPWGRAKIERELDGVRKETFESGIRKDRSLALGKRSVGSGL